MLRGTTYPHSNLSMDKAKVAEGNGSVADVAMDTFNASSNKAQAYIKEGLHVTQLLQFIQAKLDGPMPVITDNKAAYVVIRCPGATKRTAHFERWMHFARDLMLRRAIEVSLVTTNKMMADFFTKPSDKTAFFRCRSYVMNLPDA